MKLKRGVDVIADVSTLESTDHATLPLFGSAKASLGGAQLSLVVGTAASRREASDRPGPSGVDAWRRQLPMRDHASARVQARSGARAGRRGQVAAKRGRWPVYLLARSWTAQASGSSWPRA